MTDDELKAINHHFHVALDMVSDGILIIRISGRRDPVIAFANGEMCRRLGRTVEELVGAPLPGFLPVDDRVMVEALLSHTELTVAPGLGLKSVDDEVHTGTWHVSPVVSDESDPPSTDRSLVLTVTWDHQPVSDSKWGSRRGTINLTKGKEQTLSHVAKGVVHDFKNGLQALHGTLEVALIEDSLQATRNRVGDAMRISHFASDLCERLLSHVNGDSDERKPIRVERLIEDVLVIANTGSFIQCKHCFADDLPCVNGDFQALKQVVCNLVINAQQSMESGGGFVHVSVDVVDVQPRDLLPVEEPGYYVRIEVRDRGVGMDKEVMERIFEPHFTTKKDGHGVGLDQCNLIIREHQGAILVDSEPGRGSVFSVYLPALPIDVHEEEPEARVQLEVPVPECVAAARILMVEDELDISRASAAYLTKKGHQVETTCDGTSALELFQSSILTGIPFDIVVLDLNLKGGMDGTKVLAKMREIDPDVVAIAASGSIENRESEMEALGFTTSLAKPFDYPKLLGIIARIQNEQTSPA